MLYTTHYMEGAERLCDRIGIIDHGHLTAEGTSRELVSQVGEKDRITLSANGTLVAFAEACRSLEGIERVDVKDSSVQLLAKDGRLRLPPGTRGRDPDRHVGALGRGRRAGPRGEGAH